MAKTQTELWNETQEWIAANPGLYRLFVKYALEKVASGHKFGIGALTERVRWEGPARGEPGEFKIPNACRRYIAIQLYLDHPEIEDFCTTNRGDFQTPGEEDSEWAHFVSMLGG